MAKNNWTHEELLLALNLYFRIPFGQFDQRNIEVQKLANFIGRTPSAVAMKLSNFASLDPNHRERGVKGLSNSSHADKEAWEEYVSNFTGETIDISSNSEHESVIFSTIEIATEAVRKTKVRLVQNRFRRHILENYRETCCVCGMPIADLLIASHIIQWSLRPDLRLEPTNGLCLCALHDKAFEYGLLAITPEYEILVSSKVKSLSSIRTIEANFELYHLQKIKLPKVYWPSPEYLQLRYQEFNE